MALVFASHSWVAGSCMVCGASVTGPMYNQPCPQLAQQVSATSINPTGRVVAGSDTQTPAPEFDWSGSIRDAAGG